MCLLVFPRLVEIHDMTALIAMGLALGDSGRTHVVEAGPLLRCTAFPAPRPRATARARVPGRGAWRCSGPRTHVHGVKLALADPLASAAAGASAASAAAPALRAAVCPLRCDRLPRGSAWEGGDYEQGASVGMRMQTPLRVLRTDFDGRVAQLAK